SLPSPQLHGSRIPRASCARFAFFFQAEDGIRDLYVTGVQTCALPILRDGTGWRAEIAGREAAVEQAGDTLRFVLAGDLGSFRGRSEERRVGKECRSRGAAYN